MSHIQRFFRHPFHIPFDSIAVFRLFPRSASASPEFQNGKPTANPKCAARGTVLEIRGKRATETSQPGRR